MVTPEVVRAGYTRVDDRGRFVEVLNAGSWACLIHGRMRRDAVMGNHYHRRTRVFFYLTSGRVDVRSVDVESGERWQQPLASDEGVLLGTNVAHAIRFLEDSSFIVLKSERYDAEDPDTFKYPVA